MPPTEPVDDPGVRRKRTGRKYTSRACEECRRRRAKCDGARPSCARCLDRGVRCQYSTAEDGRQPAPKSYVVMLRNRIELLERVLHSHGIDIDASIAQVMAESGTPEQEALSSCGNGCSVDDLCLTFDGALTLDESLNFDQDGEVRYFGPTSGRLLFRSEANDSSPNDDAYQTDTSCLAEECRKKLNQSQSIAEGDLVSEELQSHLIDLYFEWEGPWLQVVNEKLFRESMANCGRYFSPLLLSSILALGSRYCDRVEVRSDPNDPNTAGKMFIEQAERLVQNDLRWPKITTIQSLAIMGMVYIAMGSDAAGWLYQGSANRLALDMGLNMDPAVLAGSVSLSSIEIELRRQIYWALYCHDKLSASYTGRVCTLLDSQGVVNKPYPQCAEDLHLPAANGEPRAASRKQKDVVYLHRAMIDLCRIFEKVLTSLWSPKPLIHPQQRFAFFHSVVLELKTWYYDLCPELKTDRPTGPSRFPHAYTLCMVYHTVHILLCVPFLNKASTQDHRENTPNQQQPTPDDSLTHKALTICSSSTRAMCIVAQKYRQTFGSFKLSPITATHCTLSAALIIMERCSLDPDASPGCGDEGSRGPSPQAAVGLCLQVLRELSTSWNIAKRIGRNLEKLYCQRLKCDLDHVPRPPTDCPATRETPLQPADANPYPESLGPIPEISLDSLDPKHLSIPDLSSMSSNATTDWLGASSYNGVPGDHGTGENEFQIAANSGELFANNLGFAFSPDCLPSDYNMFDTLNQMYLEEMW